MKYNTRSGESGRTIINTLRAQSPLAYPNLKGYRVTIMGLGLHGGGLVSSLFFLNCGAEVTITDLKGEEKLQESIKKLEREKPPNSTYKLILGEHREIDFKNADLIIKNPGVPWSSRYLKIAREQGIPIETDISIFLRLKDNPIIAVTGSKGKSTTSAAIHCSLKSDFPGAKLGGNITVSPLAFIHQLHPRDPVVLELSSWQLADLRGKGVLKPKISLITNILHDHQDKYNSMEEYIADKIVILENQDRWDFTILNLDDAYWRRFAEVANAQVLFSAEKPFSLYKIEHKQIGNTPVIEGAYLRNNEGYLEVVPRSPNTSNRKLILKVFDSIKLRGHHNRKNMLMASLAAYLFGIDIDKIKKSVSTFGGLEHRMELFYETSLVHGQKLLFYNDSAATIPEATVNAILSLEEPTILITGGTDKNLDFSVFKSIIFKPEEIFLLEGSATDKIITLLNLNGRKFRGPYNKLETLLYELKKFLLTAFNTSTTDISIVFSPGCASFELFKNEFHRGEIFKQLVNKIFNPGAS